MKATLRKLNSSFRLWNLIDTRFIFIIKHIGSGFGLNPDIIKTHMRNRAFVVIAFFLVSSSYVSAQRLRKKDLPAVHNNLSIKDGKVVVEANGKEYPDLGEETILTLKNMQGNPRGTKKGIAFDFGLPGLTGKLYYGFIPYGDSKHPHPVYFRAPASVEGGKAEVNLLYMRGRYDMIGWEKNGYGTLGFRLVNSEGLILYDGKVSFSGTSPFKVAPTIMEGPFVNLLHAGGATISLETNEETVASLTVDGKSYESAEGLHHEITVDGLEADKEYAYTIKVGNDTQQYSLKTAPSPGSRKPFVFAYASDSRSGQGGGERDIYGANFYIMKKILALANQQGSSFMQFSGDLIDGYLASPAETHLQYANWKRAIEPWAHYFPVYVSMGNHEALGRKMGDGSRAGTLNVDRFPYETESAEAVFGSNFVNPTNGPTSEDGASYDPDPEKMDFPSYNENVFYYTYDNVAVIVLNSDYWYAPTSYSLLRLVSGGLHGYIMDQQLAWLEKTVTTLEGDENIDHIFVTQHTPCFPNGGHVQDDMWYNGNNSFRPYVAGKPLAKGIIERRDQILDILVNKSTKALAILTGDEHNYARTRIDGETEIYPENYFAEKITLSRHIFQINNGAAGAPYYAQEQTPWSPQVSGFTTQNALVLFHIDGKKVSMRVVNPDTLEEVDSLEMR